MAALQAPDVYIPDFGKIIDRGNNAFARGREDYQAGITRQAGQKMAGGDYKGARNAFFSAGMVDQGLNLQTRIDSMDDRQREAAKRISGVVGNLALAADTPEKWTAGIGALRAKGMDVGKYADFSTRDAAIAEAGLTANYLELADKRARDAREAAKPIEVGGALVVPQKDGSVKEVYAARAKPFAPQTVSPGQRVIDSTGREIYAAPDKENDKLIVADKKIYNPKEKKWIVPPAGEADGKDRREAGKFEMDLRKEYTSAAKDYRAIQDGVARVEEGAKIGKGAGDIALIYGFMKINDPGSVVRETEFDIAQNIGSLPDRWQSAILSRLEGQQLPANVRAEIVTAARALAKAKGEEQATVDADFRRIAEENGVDPTRVVLPYGKRTPAEKPDKPLPAGGFKATMKPAQSPFGATSNQAQPQPVPGAPADLKGKTTDELFEMLRQGQ